MSEQENKYKAIKDLFGAYRLPIKKGIGGGEVGELLRYFCERLNPVRIKDGYEPLTERAVAKILHCMMRKSDLFWLKSVCEDAERRGFSFSKRFWYYAKQQKSANDFFPIPTNDTLHSGKV